MTISTLYNSTNHPLTWDKVNETLKVIDDNFTFVSSQATTGVLQNLSQDITPNSVGTFDLGTPTQRWDNVYANSLSVSSLIANVTGDLKGSVFADDSSIIVDGVNGKITGEVTGTISSTNWMASSDSYLTIANGGATGPGPIQIVASANLDLTSGTNNDIKMSPHGSGRVKVSDGGLGIVEAATFIGHADQTMYLSSKTAGSESTHITLNSTSGVQTTLYGAVDFVSGGSVDFTGSTIVGTIQGNTQGTHTGGVIGNVLGNIDGDVTGSVYSEDSSGVLVDGLHGVLNTHKLDQVGATDGQALVWDAGNNRWQPGAAAGGGGTGLGSRTTKSASTSSIADGVISNTNILGAFSAYMVLKLQVDGASWVRVYTDAASRTADASRIETDDPAPGAGVVVETITTGADTILISPAVLGFNDESPVTDVIPIAVKNKSGITRTFTVTLTLIQLEA